MIPFNLSQVQVRAYAPKQSDAHNEIKKVSTAADYKSDIATVKKAKAEFEAGLKALKSQIKAKQSQMLTKEGKSEAGSWFQQIIDQTESVIDEVFNESIEYLTDIYNDAIEYPEEYL